MSRYLGRFNRFWSRSSKKKQERSRQIEQLERRDLLAAAVWHNPIFALDVTGDQPARVTALDALRVINWLNNPSQPRQLPRQVDYSTHGQYVDTNCDGRVSAIDALRVINHLNGVGAGEVGGFFTDGGSFSSAACSPQLLEGTGFATELERVLKIPTNRPALEVTFQAPEFDTLARQQIRDAFEIQIVQVDGSLLSNPISSSRTAAFNWTEGYQPVSANGMWMDIASPGQDSKVTFDLSEFPADTEIRVLARLVNNDNDETTSVIIRGYEFVELPTAPPSVGSGVLAESLRLPVSEFDIRQLSDLTGLFEFDYGRTSLGTDKSHLETQAELTNRSNSAVLGPLVAVFENFSDPNVFLVRPDGFLQDGRPFFDLSGSIHGSALASGRSIVGPSLRFRNDSGQRFDYRLSVFGRVNPGPAGFSSQPINSVEAGKLYRYDAQARPMLDSPLIYSVSAGPEELTINSSSGSLQWQTRSSDIGSHKVTLRATDEFGMFTEQTFELQVLEVLPNRPPVFVSTPGTEAVAAGAFDVITLPTGSMPAGLAVGNFGVLNSGTSINELSLVAINQGSQTLSLIPGLGRDGAGRETYGPMQTLTVGEPPRGDELFRGVLDIDVGLPPLGNTTYDSNRIMGLVHGDFNDDGILDVATSIVYQYRSFVGTDHYERRIAITLGDGDGTFKPATHLPIPGPVVFTSDSLGAISLRAHDFDSDGNLDLLLSETKGKKLLFYKGVGDGSFAPAEEQGTGTDIAGFKVADLNGDSQLDLLAIRADGRAFGVLLGNGNGSFQPYAEFSTHTGDTVNHNFALGDLNGDGWLDFVSGNHSTRYLNIYLGNGDGTFSRSIDLPARAVFSTNPSSLDWPMAVVIGDFSGNGHADIAYTTYANSGFGTGYGGGIALYEGHGSGSEFSWSTSVDLGMSLAPINIHGDAQPVDLNNDGHMDMVFTGPGEWGNFAPGVNVAINDGSGKFTTTFWIDSNMGTDPRPGNLNNGLGVFVGDFNNDGMLDLLTARNGRGSIGNQFSSVSLLLADSPGTYQAPYDVRAQSVAWGTQTFVEYADFNNDGILDIWGPAYQNPSFTQLGNGDGTFQRPITATPYIGNEGLGKGFVADLDLDGNLDVVWFGGGGVQGGPQGRYLAALGNGDGSFQISFAQTGNNTPSGYAPIAMKPADFDGDGHMDFVALTGLFTIEIMRNVPEVPGTFTRSFSVPFGSSTLRPSLAAGDFDGDGLPDVIAVREQSNRVHNLLFFKGNGDGTLAEPTLFAFAPDLADFRFPQQIAVGDLNSDGKLDFVINASYNRSAVVLGNGDGTFQSPLVYRTGTIFGGDGGLHLVDLNGDGHLDLVSGNDEFNNSPRGIEIRIGLGDGTFGNAQLWGTSEGVGQMVFGDLDNDGRLDVGYNGSSRQEAVATYLGSRQGLSGVLTTDINGDGPTDILAINHDNSHVKRLINDGRGSFMRLDDLLVGAGPVDLLSGDLNGNGHIDFLTINRSGRSISVMLADGLGGYSRTDVPLGRVPVAGALAKVSGGEQDDLLVIDAQLNALFILTQDGSGVFTESALIPLGDKPGSISVGKVDGDDLADVIVSLPETNRLLILRSLGSGQFADPTYVNLPAKPGKIAAGDLNGDGLLDLAVTFPETGEVALLLGMGQSRFTQPQRIRVGSQPDSIVMADANGDGLLDILVTNAGDNTASVILNRFDPNQLYRYDALAIDPDDDSVTYSILEGPGGMILNAATGEIRWAPMGDQIGTQRVVLEANDGRGGRATQEFSISVEAARTNAAPVITTLPSSMVSAEHAFTTTVSATDPDSDRLRYRLVDGPEGASVDPVTGQIDWDPRGTAMQLNRLYFPAATIELPHIASQNVSSLTLEGWFRFAKSDGYQVLIDKSLNWNTPSFFTLRYFVGNLQFLIGDGTAAGVDTLSVARALPTEEWVHLSAAFDGTTGKMDLLINGVHVATKTSAKRIGIPADNVPFRISQHQNVYPFHGDVYGVRMWDAARTTEQINEAMHQSMAAGTPDLVIDLRFNEGDSLSVINHVDHNHRGLISGTVVPKRIVGMAPLQSAQFTVSVEDGKGGFDLQTFSVTVAPKLPGSITGTLFSDDNRDGSRQADEALLMQWTVFIDQNNNGNRDADEPFSVTDANGVYQFNQLLQGDNKIAVEPRAGFSAPPVRMVSVLSQQVTTGDIAAEPLSPGQVRGRLTQADSSQTLAHQQVFADINGNGLWDYDEPTTMTDADGRYAIGGLQAGSYSLRVRSQAAWRVTQPAAAAHDVVLASHDLLEDLDFVIQPNNSIAAASPQIVTEPPRSAAAGQPYRYAVSSISRDGRPIVYSLSLSPAGMVIDARTGQIAWTPNGKQTGSQQVIVRAATDNTHVDLQAYFIDVAPANTAPVVTSSPASPAAVGRLWSYPIMAQDAEQSELSYSWSVAPAGATIDAESGLVRWTPTASQVGAHAFTVIVNDNAGGIALHSFTLDVVSVATSTLPFTIRSPRDNASLLTPYLSRVTGIDASGQPLAVSLLSGPDDLTLDASGFIEWSPTVAQLGEHSLSIRFSSSSGSIEEHSYSISVRQSVGNSAPQIQSTPSTLLAVAGQLYAYDMLLTDTDNDALSFELVAAPDGLSIHPQLGTLRWLPTLDQLGQSNVTVRVIDPQGGSDTQSFTLTTRRLGGPPLFQSVPSTQAVVGIGYLYTVKAVDAENDPLTYSLIEAPAGMTIDLRTGEIAWTPAEDQFGQQAVFIAVSDASGNRSTQGFSIEVAAGLPNRPPLISSQPNLFATVGESYNTIIQATDPEGAPVTYSLRRGPEGMTVDSATGAVNWTPTTGQAGRAIVTLVAIDAQGGASVQSFEIDVLGVNTPPEIISTPPAFTWARGLFQYDLIARDVDRDPIRYEFVSSVPNGMTIDPLGRITWQTQADHVGSYSITVRASDPRGGQATQQIDFEVRADNVLPKVTVLPRGGGWPWDGPIVVFVSAVDNVGVVDVELRVNDQVVALDANRTVRLSFDDWGPGVLNMVATARDAAGNEGTGTATSFYRDPEVDYESGEGLPVASITTPSDDGTVYGMVEIIGTAMGGTAAATGFKEYRLSYARLDQLRFTEFVHSTSPVTDGLLGVWDTTLLENDSYVLRLEVVSEAGNTSVHETSVGLSGNLKLGNFRLSFEDLTIPVAGIPITIVRTYDTLRADRDGDFGFGWRMEYRNTDLRVSLPKSGLEDLGIYTPFRSGTKIYATLPGGQRVGWTFTPEMKVLPGWAKGNDLVMASPRYTPDRGNTATLSAGNGWLTVNQFGELYATAGMPWNPASPDFGGGFTVTLDDGTRYFIDGATGLMQTATDRNGNRLTFSDSGITSSLGDVRISIARDRHNRITSITDPAGNAIRYGYSPNGDLIKVTDREENVVRIEYRLDRPHFLERIVDPLNRPAIRSEYNADGRLIRTVSADGSFRSIDYDPDSSIVTVTDPLGNPTTTEYDLRGNVVSVVDALGGVERFEYDEFGNVIKSIDPLGQVSQSEYNVFGYLVRSISVGGGETRYSRDVYGQPTATVDALGGTVRNEYDSKGRLLKTIDALNATRRYERDQFGNLLREYDSLGNVTTYQRDTQGRAIAITDALNNTRRLDYDSNGMQVAEHITRTLSDGSRILESTSLNYDKNGNLIRQIAPDAGVTTFVYNALGQVIQREMPDGSVESIEYDSLGQPSQLIDGNGQTTAIEYDANGRITKVTNPLGEVNEVVRDALGRAIEVKWNHGTSKRIQYDALGRIIAEIDELGRVWQYEYSPSEERLITPDGSVTSRRMDLLGRVVATTDRQGKTTHFEYDLNGQRISEMLPSGSQARSLWTLTGQLAAEIDAVGNTKSYRYDVLDRLISVTDFDGSVATYHYDEVGNVVSVIDALGRETRQAFDPAGRVVNRTKPLGQAEAFQYDQRGNLTEYRDAAGQSIKFEYDARGNLVSILRGQTDETLQQWDSLDRRSRNSSTTFVYNPQGLLAQAAWETGQVVEYEYDAVGNIKQLSSQYGTTRYGFNERNEIRQIVTPTGSEIDRLHDPAGRIILETWDGFEVHRTFDEDGEVASIRNFGPNGLISSYEYTRDSLGRQIRIVEMGPATLSRTINYEYDALSRLTRESYASENGHLLLDIRYAFDAVGNRIWMSRTEAGSAYVTTYTYDLNDRLTVEETRSGIHGPVVRSISYGYDSRGNVTSRTSEEKTETFYYDQENRIIRVEIDGASQSTLEYSYDSDGNRVSKTINGFTSEYNIDANQRLPRVIAQSNAAETIAFVYDADAIIARSTSSGDEWFLRDGSGSIRQIVKADGTITAIYDYDSYGNETRTVGLLSNEFRYRGEQLDDATGTYFLRARNYDPTTGRFMSVDPVQGTMSVPISLHDYLYVGADPVNRVDPSGQSFLIDALATLSIRNTLLVSLSIGAVSGSVTYAQSEGDLGLALRDAAATTGKAFMALSLLKLGAGLYVALQELTISAGTQILEVGVGKILATLETHTVKEIVNYAKFHMDELILNPLVRSYVKQQLTRYASNVSGFGASFNAGLLSEPMRMKLLNVLLDLVAAL